MRGRNVLRTVVLLSLPLSALLAAGACGETTDSTPSPDAGADATSGGDGAAGSGDSSTSTPDTSTSSDAAVASDTFHPTPRPDGGPNPTFACITDGGFPCPTPPSECVDDYWLRYYQNGACVDGGCVFQAQDILCEPEIPGEPPFCENGGCKYVVLR